MSADFLRRLKPFDKWVIERNPSEFDKEIYWRIVASLRKDLKGRLIMAKPKPAQDEKGRFVPGNNGGAGRPKGSRNLLGEAFIADLYEHW